MKDKALGSIAAHQMIERGDTVVAGFSGGADSVALLHFLQRHSEALGIKQLLACHINHNLRGEEALRDERFARQFCAGHGIVLQVLSVDIAALARERGQSIELCARQERYHAFAALCQSLGGAKIATAHTLSDSIETALLNFARGTGLRGMGGIPAVRDNIIRPLIACTRTEIEQYCHDHALSFVQDSSNESLLYTRNRIRHRVLPALREVNPAYERGMQDAMYCFAEDNAFLESLAKAALARAQQPGGYSCAALLSHPPPVFGRAILLLLKEHGAQPSRRRVELIANLLRQGGAVEVCAGLYFEVRGGTLRIKQAAEPQAYFEKPFAAGKIELFEGSVLHILLCDCEQYNKFKKNHADVLKNVLDYDRIGSNAVLRQRLPSDSIRLANRGCTKSLKKLFYESGIPPQKRDRIVVAADSDGVFWVQGAGVAQRVHPSEETKRFCIIIED